MKLLINDLIKRILGLNPMYSAPNFKSVLRLTDIGSFTDSFTEIVRRSLSEFELKYPLLMWDKSVYINKSGDKYTFQDNFKDYINGNITEESLELIPTSILHYTDGLLKQYRDFSYVRPQVRIKKSGLLKISYFTKYPLVINKDKHEDEFSDDSYIYGLELDAGPHITYFLYILEFNLLMALRDQKQQMSYSEQPLDFYQGLDERQSKVEEWINDWYQNPIWYSRLYM